MHSYIVLKSQADTFVLRLDYGSLWLKAISDYYLHPNCIILICFILSYSYLFIPYRNFLFTKYLSLTRNYNYIPDYI